MVTSNQHQHLDIHSLSTSLGRAVHQLVHANIQSANHVVATKCMKVCRNGQEVQLFFQTKCQNSEKIVGARPGGLNISENADLLGFPRTTVSRVCREWCKKEKTFSEQQFCRQKCIVNERGQWIHL